MSRKQRTCLDKKDKRGFIFNIYLNKDKYFIAIYVYRKSYVYFILYKYNG